MSTFDLTYFTCTLGEAAQWKASSPNRRQSFKTVLDMIEQQANEIPELPALGFPGFSSDDIRLGTKLHFECMNKRLTRSRAYSSYFPRATESIVAGSKYRGEFEERMKGVLKEIESSHEMIVLFVDEIHRFNKAQQDAFLPYVEKGSIILIGATTENPSFELNPALLSRCRVFVLHAERYLLGTDNQ